MKNEVLIMKVLSKLKNSAMYALAPLCPELCSKFLYKRAFSRRLNLRNPQTLNEKIIWLKLNTYRDNPQVTQCADKYGVREYVQEAGFGHTLNQLYGVWDRAEDIDFTSLPDRFVLKCTHASGFNWLCSDKSTLDINACVAQMKKWLSYDFWRRHSELQYRKVPKRVIAERFLWDGKIPTDYKFYCFHGHPLYVLVCSGTKAEHRKFYFFDREWNFCPITRDGQHAGEGFTLPRPACFDKMLECARALSEPFPFVRVDLYEDDGRVIFGELTFTPSAGMDTGRLPETDLILGKLLKLPI